MFTEELKLIKDAEDQADKMRKEAKVSAKKLTQETDAKADKMVEEAFAPGRENNAKLCLKTGRRSPASFMIKPLRMPKSSAGRWN